MIIFAIIRRVCLSFYYFFFFIVSFFYNQSNACTRSRIRHDGSSTIRDSHGSLRSGKSSVLSLTGNLRRRRRRLGGKLRVRRMAGRRREWLAGWRRTGRSSGESLRAWRRQKPNRFDNNNILTAPFGAAVVLYRVLQENLRNV